MLNPEMLKSLAQGKEFQIANEIGGGGVIQDSIELTDEKVGIGLVTGPMGEEETRDYEVTVKVPEQQANRFAGLVDAPLGAQEVPTKSPVNAEALKAAGLGNAGDPGAGMQVIEGTMKFVPSLGKHAKPEVKQVHLSADELSQEGFKSSAHAPTSIALGDISGRLKK